MARVKLILKVIVGTFGFLLYVWVAAVRLAPRAKRRRALRRAVRRASREPGRSAQRDEDDDRREHE